MGAMRTTPEFKQVLRRILIGAPLAAPSEQAVAMQLQQNEFAGDTLTIRPTICIRQTDRGIRVEAMVGELRVAFMDTVHLASGDRLELSGITMALDVEVFDR
jgi:hypothetical protein